MIRPYVEKARPPRSQFKSDGGQAYNCAQAVAAGAGLDSQAGEAR